MRFGGVSGGISCEFDGLKRWVHGIDGKKLGAVGNGGEPF